jgi:hypothetical protein
MGIGEIYPPAYERLRGKGFHLLADLWVIAANQVKNRDDFDGLDDAPSTVICYCWDPLCNIRCEKGIAALRIG